MGGDSLCLTLSRIHPYSSICGPSTVEKYTCTHAHTRVYQRKCFPHARYNDDEQSLGQGLQQAWCVLASHYAAPIWAGSCSARWSSRRWEGLSCLSRIRPKKHTSKMGAFPLICPQLFRSHLYTAPFFLLPLHALPPPFPFYYIVHLLSAKNEIKKQQKISCIHFLMLKML